MIFTEMDNIDNQIRRTGPAHISEILKVIIGEIIEKAKDNEQSDETES